MKTKNGEAFISLSQLKKETVVTPQDEIEYRKEYEEFIKENRKEVLEEFGQKMKSAREKAKVTQEELASKLQTTRSVISRIEKGDQNLTVEYVIKIAHALGKNFEIRIY